MIEDIYNDDDNDDNNVSRKSINNLIDDTDDDDWKLINNGFLQPVGKRKGATGMMYEHEKVLYVILQIVLSIFLQLGCEWILKKYRVDNVLQIVLSISLQLGCEWVLKKYRVDNDIKMDWILKWYRVDNDPVDSFPTSAFVDKMLEWTRKKYREY